MRFSETSQIRLLSACLLIAFLLMALMAVLMGAEYDEAWIISSARQAFSPDAIPSVSPVATTGGLQFFLVGLTQGLPVSPLAVPRILSLLSIAAIYVVVVRGLQPHIPSLLERRLLAVSCLAAPGTILLAGMGYGVVLATLLFLSGLLVAMQSDRITLKAAVMAGVLIGTAVATRWTLIPALPAILLCAFFTGAQLWRNLMMCLLISLVAIAVFAALLALQIELLDGLGPQGGVSVATNLGSAGVGSGLPPPARMYSYVIRFATTLPISLLFLALAALFIWRKKKSLQRVVVVLLLAALLITSAWIVSSPWMHLRYIWPAYLMISICAGLSLVALHRFSKDLERPGLSAAVTCFAALLAMTQVAVAVRIVAIGAPMQINTAGHENLENHFKPFHHIQEQRAILQYLRSLPADAVVGAIGMPGEFGAIELALLSDRQVIEFANQNARNDLAPDYIITHRFSPFNDAGFQWLETLGPPVEEISGYTLYPFPSGSVIPPKQEILLDRQLYRFSLEKWASLTWF